MKPLLILDCDEVILEFAAPFKVWLLEQHGIELRYDSYALYGNMRFTTSGALVPEEDIHPLVETFLVEETARQYPTPGALAALRALRGRCDVVVLTNIPSFGEGARRQHLGLLGLSFPVVANSGPKGEAVQHLAQGRQAAFVDDAPLHHQSVQRTAPDVRRLQLVASPILHTVIPSAPAAEARLDRWGEALPWLENWLAECGSIG